MFERVMRRLREEKDLGRVARATGLSYSWLIQLKKGRYDDPGVKKIEILDHYYREVSAA